MFKKGETDLLDKCNNAITFVLCNIVEPFFFSIINTLYCITNTNSSNTNSSIYFWGPKLYSTIIKKKSKLPFCRVDF